MNSFISSRMGAFCISLAGLALANQAWADVITITSSMDTTIFANNVNNSAGGAVAMFSGTDGNSSVKRALAEFDIADNVPAGSTITGVQLTLFLAQTAGNVTTGTETIGLFRLTDSWREGTVGAGGSISGSGQGNPANSGDATWSDRFFSSTSPTAWTNAGGDFNSTASASATVGATVNNGYTWGSTTTLISDVQGWLDNPSKNFGWMLINSDETDQRTYRAFYTREESTAALQPELQITFTPAPEPASLMLVSFGIPMLLMRRRQKRIAV